MIHLEFHRNVTFRSTEIRLFSVSCQRINVKIAYCRVQDAPDDANMTRELQL